MGLDAISFGRPACPTSCERQPRPDPRQPALGSKTTLDGGAVTALPQGAGYAEVWLGSERSWQAGSTSFCPETRPRLSTSGEWGGPPVIGAGGAVAARGSRATSFHKMPTLDARDLEAVAESRGGLRVGGSEGSLGPPSLP